MGLIAFQALGSPEVIRIVTGAFFGGVAGLVCGLLPYFLARRRDNRRLGKVAFFACAVSGVILGLILALPMAVAFSVAVLTGGDPAMNRVLNASARGNTGVLHQIINGGADQTSGEVTENPTPEEQTMPEQQAASASDESSEPRRPLVENLFS